MFIGSSAIEGVVELLERRDVSLWHACQLNDLPGYRDLHGIPSRNLLELAGQSFTSFVTDASDRAKGLWPKVFLNLADFGRSFALGWNAVPNPYGPVVFQIHPRALARASDVAICLRSAGASDFDRDTESLDSPEDVERVFRHPASAGQFDRMQLRFGEELRTAFNPRHPEATTVELSLTMDPELVPMSDVVAVWVDPIVVGDFDLLPAVEAVLGNRVARIRRRSISEDRRVVLGDIVRVLFEDGPPILRLLTGRHDVDARTREWAAAVEARGLQWQFQRYAGYLRDGTLSAIDRPSTESQYPRSGMPAARAAERGRSYGETVSDR